MPSQACGVWDPVEPYDRDPGHGDGCGMVWLYLLVLLFFLGIYAVLIVGYSRDGQLWYVAHCQWAVRRGILLPYFSQSHAALFLTMVGIHPNQVVFSYDW